MSEESPTEHEAIAVGLALVCADYKGKSDFDKGMRLLQRHLKPKKRVKVMDSGKAEVLKATGRPADVPATDAVKVGDMELIKQLREAAQ